MGGTRSAALSECGGGSSQLASVSAAHTQTPQRPAHHTPVAQTGGKTNERTSEATERRTERLGRRQRTVDPKHHSSERVDVLSPLRWIEHAQIKAECTTTILVPRTFSRDERHAAVAAKARSAPCRTATVSESGRRLWRRAIMLCPLFLRYAQGDLDKGNSNSINTIHPRDSAASFMDKV